MDPFAPRLLLAKDRTPTRWKNAAGSAVTVASGPADATSESFDWRVSIATIDKDADFSSYPGIQRYLMPLSAGILTMAMDDITRDVPMYETTEFAGESTVRAINVAGTTLDLNLMVRRRAGHGRLTAHVVDGSANVSAAPGEIAIIVILEANFGLDYLDAVELQPNSNLDLVGSGPIAIARIILDATS